MEAPVQGLPFSLFSAPQDFFIEQPTWCVHALEGFPSMNRMHVALALALIVATAGTTSAAMVAPLRLADVTHEAAYVVHATVLAVRSGRDQSGLPATWITLAVTRTLKGPHRAQLTIKQYGVASPLPDGTITRVDGLPRYRVGEEMVLFLRGTSRRGFTSPVGFAQGAYRVRRNNGRALVRGEQGTEGTRELDEFLAEIAGLATQVP